VLTRRESLASRRFRPGVEQDTGRTEHV